MRQRWVHPSKLRYYQADLEVDLLGDWTLVLCWGGLNSRLGGMKIVQVADQEIGMTRLMEIGRRRRQHGYQQEI